MTDRDDRRTQANEINRSAASKIKTQDKQIAQFLDRALDGFQNTDAGAAAPVVLLIEAV